MRKLTTMLALALGVSGCGFHGGVATVRTDGSTLETSSTSASVGTGGVSSRSSHTVRHLD